MRRHARGLRRREENATGKPPFFKPLPLSKGVHHPLGAEPLHLRHLIRRRHHHCLALSHRSRNRQLLRQTAAVHGLDQMPNARQETPGGRRKQLGRRLQRQVQHVLWVASAKDFLCCFLNSVDPHLEVREQVVEHVTSIPHAQPSPGPLREAPKRSGLSLLDPSGLTACSTA